MRFAPFLLEGIKQTVRNDIKGQEVSPNEMIEIVQEIKIKINNKVIVEVKY
ncbi:hypothetical protein [Bacillus sp. 71mf]|uniref:hypothetical protein n=1 Tax=Bacillus sp. 71mf TaxID=1761757 RepID=UPI0015871C8F|nr:hypothetical protein [Bacillus sp. 71mf]